MIMISLAYYLLRSPSAERFVTSETERIKAMFGDSIESTEKMMLKGRARPDSHRGHEHFGYKDGISQPALR